MRFPFAGTAVLIRLLPVIEAFADEELCSADNGLSGACQSDERHHILLQQGFRTKDHLVLEQVDANDREDKQLCPNGGVFSDDRCWYLSDLGQNCDDTCSPRGLSYSFVAPSKDITPLLVGHVPQTRQEPWLFVECYVPGEDRYHTYNPNAWGVPAKTPAGEMAEVGQHRYETCRLACPCAFSGARPAPVSPPVPVPAPSTTSVQAQKCGDGVGIFSVGRCWYLSEINGNCDNTCQARGLQYAFAEPVEDITPKLVGHMPAIKQDPWAFVECYVGKEDRYHPMNKNAWGVPAKTPPQELSTAGQHTYESCQLACPCSGGSAGPAPIQSTPQPAGRPAAPVSPGTETAPASAEAAVVASAKCEDGIGISTANRCWYLSDIGKSCDDTCAARGLQYLFASAAADVTPALVNHIPRSKQEPWLFTECYVPKEDRYHPANPNVWGNPLKTPPTEIAQVGRFFYETCRLACPCAGTTGTQPSSSLGPMGGFTPSPVPIPAPSPLTGPATMVPTNGVPVPSPFPVPSFRPSSIGHVPGETGGTAWTGPITGQGIQEFGRAWYMSEAGGNCRDTCAAQGLVYSYTSIPSDSPMTPRILGHEPALRQSPWAAVECYVPQEDRYHTASKDAWGVPEKTPAAERAKAAMWSHAECRLACPCTLPEADKVQCRWEQPPACVPQWDYKGQVYNGCSTIEHDKPWCQHHAHPVAQSEMVWSDCIYTCGSESQPALTSPGALSTTSNCEWVAPEGCSPEFTYEGSLVAGCSTADNHSPWCSRTPEYSGLWSHCKYRCENPTESDTKQIAALNRWAEEEKELCSWVPPAACAKKFIYKGTEFAGCAMWENSPSPWCSHDLVHIGKFSLCERKCTTITLDPNQNTPLP